MINKSDRLQRDKVTLRIGVRKEGGRERRETQGEREKEEMDIAKWREIYKKVMEQKVREDTKKRNGENRNDTK